MIPDQLAEGTRLPEYRARAEHPAEPAENRVHDDQAARALGFKAGLVPGFIVYAWMTHPVVQALGLRWIESGTFRVRFVKPIYYEETATVQATVAARTNDSVAVEVLALNPAGEACATATMALAANSTPPLPDLSAYAAAPLPAERPDVSREYLARLGVLGTPELLLDGAAATGFLGLVNDTLPVYAGAAAPAHPAVYLDQANRAVDRNVRVSPWLHVESSGRHLSAARVGERLSTRGTAAGLYERNGHEFVELDLLLLAGDARPIAAIRHVAIYKLRQAPSGFP